MREEVRGGRGEGKGSEERGVGVGGGQEEHSKSSRVISGFEDSSSA
jgi:hypothetical protein